MTRLTRRIIVSALALLVLSTEAQTAYPNKPIRLIVPTVAGGPSDAAARVLARGMGVGLGQEVVVENRPGANNGVGAAAVLAAAPDGYTLFFALVANAGLPYLSKTSPYKSITEFSLIASIGGNTLCLVVPSSLQVKTLAAFASLAKASPKPLLRGANTVAEDMLAGQITNALGISLERVPYKGAAQALPDLLEGRIHAAVMPVGASVPHVRSGSLTMLGCSAADRFAALPAVPTLAESGVSAAPLITGHFVLGPPRLPQDIVDRLAKSVQQAAATTEFKQEMDRLLISGGARSLADARALLLQAEAQYVQYVRETGANID
jgi:tripartite-type tricarboxylate transporter receptor subunit TctC